MSPDGKWRWVRHLDNALVCRTRPTATEILPDFIVTQVVNLGDTMEMLSGGFYKGTIHRVVQPPPDQRDRPRLGAYYFALADDDVTLVPFAESPVLQRVGIVRKCADEDAPTMREWRRSRVMAYGLKETKKRDEVVEEQEIVKGIILKHYN